MKKSILFLAAGIFAVLFFVGCSAERTREDKVAAMINKIDSPFLVASMTPQNLMDKSGILDGVLPFTYELILGFFIDESVTGIDYSVKTQIVVGKGESFQPSMYGIFKVKDEGKFVELIEKEANATIVEKEGMKTAIKTTDGYALVWNEEFAVISNIPIDFMAMLSGTGGDGGEKTVNKLIEIIKSADKGDIHTTYADFLKKDADLSMYYDGKGMYAFLMDMMGQNGGEDIEKMRETYEGVSSEFYLNFNEGSIDLDFTNHLSDVLKEKMTFMGEKGVENNLLNYGNSSDPILTGGYNMDFSKFFEFLKSQMEDDVYRDFEEDVEESGLTVEDVKSALGGQFVYIIDHIVEFEELVDYGYGDPYTYTNTMPMFGLVMSVSNASIIQAVLADSLKLPNGIYQMGDAFLALDGNVLFASNDSAWASKVQSKNTTKITMGTDVIAANPFALYMDFTKLSQSNGMKEVAGFFQIFENFSGGANLEGGNFSMKMKDASKNSLRVLTEVVAAELDRQEKSMNRELESELENAVQEGLEELEESL
jgi:hypothetical protein